MTKPKSKNTKIPKEIAEKEFKELKDIFLYLSKFSVSIKRLIDKSKKTKFQIAHEWNYKSIETLRRRLSKGITHTSTIEDVATLLNVLGYKLELTIKKK